MRRGNLDREQVLEAIRESEATRVRVAVTDIDGVLRGKLMHKQKFLKAVDSGFGFCNVVLGWDIGDVCYDREDVRYTGWHTGYPDADVELDLSTYRTIPWDDGVPFVLGEFVDADGGPLALCPRQTLRRVIRRAEEHGLRAMFGAEFEFFCFRETPQSLRAKHFKEMEPLSPGMFGYSVLRSSLNHEFFTALMEEHDAFGVPLEGLHTETGPGVLEAAILYSDALEAADRAVLFKTATKEIGYRFGIMPTFMAKWNAQLPGCSGHLHQSLWDVDGKINRFWDEDGEHGMSDMFRHYLGGQLALLPELLALYAPTINSYKRLVEGHWAPTRSTWGVDNRTPALRVIPGSSKSIRLETRITGSDINPYLAMAAALASGLYGIEQEFEPGPAIEGNAYKAYGAEQLPRNLWEATERLDASEAARELLGDEFVDHFVATRRWEWEQYHEQVSDWELQRYFELV